MNADELASAIHSNLGPRVQKEIDVGDVKKAITGLSWDDNRSSRPVPHLMVNRLRFKGEKRLSGKPEPIDYDQKFAPGVNVILIEKNLVGKSSILKIIKFALTGDNDDFDKDVKTWIKAIWLEFSLGARDFTVVLAYVEDDWQCVLATGKESGPLSEVVESLTRKDQHHIGLPAIQQALAELFFREYSLAVLGWTQSHANGDVIESSTSWQTYFQALRIKDDDHKYLMCEPVAGLANQEQLLFMMFLGLHLAKPLNQLGVEQSTLKKTQQLSEKEVEELKAYKETLQESKKKAQTRLDEIQKAQRQRREAVLTGDLPNQIAAAEGEQLQAATEITGLEAQQRELSSQAQRARAQAKRIRAAIELQGEFSGLDVTLCPRCSKPIPDAEIERESETHECRLCSRMTSQASPEYVEQLELEAADYEEEAQRLQSAHTEVGRRIAELRAQEDLLKARAEALRGAIVDGVSSSYPTPAEDSEKAKLHESIGKIGHQLFEIEQKLGSVQGGGVDAEKRGKIIQKVRDVLKEEAEHRNESINERLKELTQRVTTAIGAKNITGISCSPLGVVTLYKNEEPVTFGGFKNPGERFRIKLALFLAMMQLGRENGLGRHPGFLLIDQLGAAEMVHDNMEAAAKLLSAIDSEFSKSIQIICSTAKSEYRHATAAKKIYGAKVKSKDGDYAF